MAEPYDIEMIGDVRVLHLCDAGLLEFEQIQATSNLFDKFIAESETDKLVVDCGQIPFWSSIALGIIVSKRSKSQRMGKTLKFCNLNPQSMWSVQASRLHTVLDICHDMEHALADF